jgi:2-polyprenyl-6-hydroxyphenyl methylase/3-demethylubiquinone-9 3-methyltransferase
LRQGHSFLDVGCGEGNLVLAAKSKFEEVYGVDISKTRIMKAQSKSQNSYIHFLQCDVQKELPFNDASFDAVTCVSVLQYIMNPSNLINELSRVLKVQGTLVIEVPNFAWLPYRLQVLLGKLPTIGEVDKFGMSWALHNFTLPILNTFLETKGFRIVHISSSGIFAKYRNWWLSLLGGDLIIKGCKC